MFDASLLNRLQCWLGLRAAPVQDDELSFQQRQVQEELQHLLVPQGRRVPMPMAVCVLAIAAMAWDKGSPAGILIWAATMFTIMSLRIWLMGRFPLLMHFPTQQRMQWLVMVSVCQGLGFSATALFSRYMTEYQCMVQTINPAWLVRRRRQYHGGLLALVEDLPDPGDPGQCPGLADRPGRSAPGHLA